MSSAAAPPLTLVCPECRRENEPERIYCHDCGARLDRSAVVARAEKTAESPDQTHQRLMGMFNQRQAKVRLWLVRALKLVLGAGIAATVMQMLLAPEVPAPGDGKTLSKMISMDLEMMTQNRRPAVLRYSEEEVNAFLASSLRNKKANLSHYFLDFDRALVGFNPGTCKVSVARQIFGYPLYTTTVYSGQKVDGKFQVTPVSGLVGRLPLHPALLKYTGFLSKDVLASFERERRLLDRVGEVEFLDKGVAFAAPH